MRNESEGMNDKSPFYSSSLECYLLRFSVLLPCQIPTPYCIVIKFLFEMSQIIVILSPWWWSSETLKIMKFIPLPCIERLWAHSIPFPNTTEFQNEPPCEIQQAIFRNYRVSEEFKYPRTSFACKGKIHNTYLYIPKVQGIKKKRVWLDFRV